MDPHEVNNPKIQHIINTLFSDFLLTQVQPYIQNFLEDMKDETYHTNVMWKLKFSQLDPSVALVKFKFA